MIVLVVITVIILIALIVGLLLGEEDFIAGSVIALLIHGVIGWLFLGNLVPTSEVTSFYDIKSTELRHFSYGSDICFYITDEEDGMTFLLQNFKDNEIFKQGDWLISVTKEYNSYSSVVSKECEIMSKTDDFEYKIVPKSEKKE
jgi:hypothetical protein